MAIIDHIDGPNRRIYLHADTVGIDLQPMDIYTAMRTFRQNDEELRKYDCFLAGKGKEQKGPGKFTERYVVCLLGTRIVPYDATQILTVIGTIITDDGQEGTACFDKTLLTITTRVDIHYQPPQVEVLEIGGTPAEIAAAVWADSDAYVNGSKGNLVNHLKHLSFRVYVDESITTPEYIGDGSQGYPFNNITTAIDYCEDNGITDLMLKSDITLDRNLKNFRMTGIGNPTVDTNGKDLTGSEFFHCNMEGDYIGQITVQQAVLRNNFWLNGFFERCTIEGNLYCKDDSLIVMLYCSSAVAGTNRPAIYGNVTGFCNLNIRDYVGGMNIRNFTQALSVMTIDGKGALTFEASNTDGIMVARGRWEPFSNLANGATVLTPVGDQSKIDTIPEDVWNHTQ